MNTPNPNQKNPSANKQVINKPNQQQNKQKTPSRQDEQRRAQDGSFKEKRAVPAGRDEEYRNAFGPRDL